MCSHISRYQGRASHAPAWCIFYHWVQVQKQVQFAYQYGLTTWCGQESWSVWVWCSGYLLPSAFPWTCFGRWYRYNAEGDFERIEVGSGLDNFSTGPFCKLLDRLKAFSRPTPSITARCTGFNTFIISVMPYTISYFGLTTADLNRLRQAAAKFILRRHWVEAEILPYVLRYLGIATLLDPALSATVAATGLYLREGNMALSKWSRNNLCRKIKRKIKWMEPVPSRRKPLFRASGRVRDAWQLDGKTISLWRTPERLWEWQFRTFHRFTHVHLTLFGGLFGCLCFCVCVCFCFGAGVVLCFWFCSPPRCWDPVVVFRNLRPSEL